MEQNEEVMSLLIATTVLWSIKMGTGIFIKEYFFPEQKTVTNFSQTLDLILEVVIKFLGICTYMCAYWLLLVCIRGKQRLSMLLLFFFVSMVFAGDYGLPSAFFLELLHRRNTEDLKRLQRDPLYKKTWSHNFVSQIGMYFLFILIIWVESSTHPSPTAVTDTETNNTSAGRATSTSTARQPTTKTSSLMERLNSFMPTYIYDKIIRYSKFFVEWICPPAFASVIVAHTHKMDIHVVTTLFCTAILLLMMFIRWKRRSAGTWSHFHSQYRPTEGSSSSLITLGLYVKVAVYVLFFLLMLILYNEIDVFDNTKIFVFGTLALGMLIVACIQHCQMSNFP